MAEEEYSTSCEDAQGSYLVVDIMAVEGGRETRERGQPITAPTSQDCSAKIRQKIRIK